MPRWGRTADALAFASSRRDWLAAQLAKRLVRPGAANAGRTAAYRGDELADRVGGKGPAPPGLATDARPPRRTEETARTAAAALAGKRGAGAGRGRPGRLLRRAGLDGPPLRLSRAQRRWGSCAGDGTIRINWRLVQAPDCVRRSVVAHEVAHLVHFDHSPGFHALLGDLFEGDIKAANRWLKAHGRGLYARLRLMAENGLPRAGGAKMLANRRATPYIRPIMAYWRKISPTGAVKDFKQVWSDNPYRWRVLAISIAATTGLLMMFIPKSERIPPGRPEVTYITTFAPGRSDAEIIASNIENQKKQDAIRAEQAKRAEFRKQMYRELGRATGLDVDEMEREIKQDEAAEKRAAEELAKYSQSEGGKGRSRRGRKPCQSIGTMRRWLAAAAGLAARARPLSRPNPAVGAIVVSDGVVVGRGWTGAGGRPHAEAQALLQAGDPARGATLYVTLEPCAHESKRGPDCTGSAIEAGISRVVIGIEDPDPRTAGLGIARLRAAGIQADLAEDPACRASLAGYLSLRQNSRPHITLKLAMSLDGCIALADGTSRWITGEEARAHAHLERARSDAILVGGGTLRTDEPRLDVRLARAGRSQPTTLRTDKGRSARRLDSARRARGGFKAD